MYTQMYMYLVSLCENLEVTVVLIVSSWIL